MSYEESNQDQAEQSVDQSVQTEPVQNMTEVLADQVQSVTVTDTGEDVLTNRPEGLPEKFKSVDDLIKSYANLEKMVGSKTTAPNEYTVELSEDLKGKWEINADDPLLGSFKEYAKANSLSNEVFNSMLNFHAKTSLDQSTNLDDTLANERAQVLRDVGFNTTPEIAEKEIKTWLVNNTSVAEEGNIDVFLQDPMALKFVAMLRTNAGMTVKNGGEVQRKSMQDFVNKKSDPRYLKDKMFTQNIDKDFAEHVKRGWI